jgi:hypothetical protein
MAIATPIAIALALVVVIMVKIIIRRALGPGRVRSSFSLGFWLQCLRALGLKLGLLATRPLGSRPYAYGFARARGRSRDPGRQERYPWR